MRPIITITANPCIDKSTSVPVLLPDKKLRCSLPKFEPGGGGINVSRAIHKLGGFSIPIYPAGAANGIFLEELLMLEQIQSVVIPIKENTRENFIVVDESANNQYRFGMPGPAIQQDEWQACLQAIRALDDIDFIVTSGSLPPGVPADFFGRVAAIAKQKGIKLILDSSGTPLKYALEEGVYLWKPNVGELSAFSDSPEMTNKSAIAVAGKIIAEKKAEVIIVSMGAGGAILITKDIQQQIVAPMVKRKSTVGAGDSMVAGVVLSLAKNKALVEAAQYGVACGTAATMNPGTELCKLKDVENLYKTMYHPVVFPDSSL